MPERIPGNDFGVYFKLHAISTGNDSSAMTTFRFFAFAFAAAFCAVALAQDDGAERPEYVVARDTPEWFKESFLDFGEDAAEAADEGKRVMIYFGQDGCPYCRKLHEDSFKDAETVRFIRAHFDSVAVNIFGDVESVWTDGDELTEKELAVKLGIQFTPTMLFLGEDGAEVARVSGYQNPERFRAALDYAAQRMDKRGKLFADHLREAARARASGVASVPNGFRPPDGGLHSPGRETLVFVSQGGCDICGEWGEFLSDNADAWGSHFRFVALDRFGEKPAASGLSESEWAEKMRIHFTPSLVFLKADGTEFFRADGYLRAFHLASAMDYAAAGASEHEPEFQRFLQERAERIRESGGEVTIW